MGKRLKENGNGKDICLPFKGRWPEGVGNDLCWAMSLYQIHCLPLTKETKESLSRAGGGECASLMGYSSPGDGLRGTEANTEVRTDSSQPSTSNPMGTLSLGNTPAIQVNLGRFQHVPRYNSQVST